MQMLLHTFMDLNDIHDVLLAYVKVHAFCSQIIIYVDYEKNSCKNVFILQLYSFICMVEVKKTQHTNTVRPTSPGFR